MSAIDAAENSLVSPRQFGKYSDEDLADSPPRPTMGAADHLGEQFVGLTRSPEAAKARHPHFIGGDDAPSVHEWLSGNRSIKRGK
jgi:hypothetical protein